MEWEIWQEKINLDLQLDVYAPRPHNLWMSSISSSVTYTRLQRLAEDKLSSLLGPFISRRKWSVVIMATVHYLEPITTQQQLQL